MLQIIITLVNLSLIGFTVYLYSRYKKQKSTETIVKKKNPFLIDIWFIAINFLLSASASICTVTLSLSYAQDKFEYKWVAGLMLITMQVFYISIKYFDAFDKSTKEIPNKNHKIKIEGENLKSVFISWIKHKLSRQKSHKKINWASILFWSFFVMMVVPASLKNSEKFINLKKEKLVRDESGIIVTDYESQLKIITTEKTEWENKVKPLQSKLDKKEELTPSEVSDLQTANYYVWLKGEEYKKTFIKLEAQNAALNTSKQTIADNKLKADQNKIDFKFDTIGIIWAFTFGILLEFGAAYSTAKGSKRLFELRKKMEKHKNKKHVKDSHDEIEISPENIETLKKSVVDLKEKITLNELNLTDDDIEKALTEAIESEKVSLSENIPDEVNPKLVEKLNELSDIKDLGTIEFSDDWEIEDSDLVKNYNPENYAKPEITNYDDYNKRIEENSNKAEYLIEKASESFDAYLKTDQFKNLVETPVIAYEPVSKKPVQEKRISIDDLLGDDNDLYPQRNLKYKKKD